MTTWTLTQARAHLGKLCNRASQGEDIGIISGNKVFLLHPIEVQAKKESMVIHPLTDDYLSQEYSVKKESIVNRDAQIENQRKSKKTVRFSGKFNPQVFE